MFYTNARLCYKDINNSYKYKTNVTKNHLFKDGSYVKYLTFIFCFKFPTNIFKRTSKTFWILGFAKISSKKDK